VWRTRYFSKDELISKLKDILAVEIQAKDSYEEDIATFKNFQILDRIRRIHNDELKHIKILRDLVETLGGSTEEFENQ
jgi:rubrerythrin